MIQKAKISHLFLFLCAISKEIQIEKSKMRNYEFFRHFQFFFQSLACCPLKCLNHFIQHRISQILQSAWCCWYDPCSSRFLLSLSPPGMTSPTSLSLNLLPCLLVRFCISFSLTLTLMIKSWPKLEKFQRGMLLYWFSGQKKNSSKVCMLFTRRSLSLGR